MGLTEQKPGQLEEMLIRRPAAIVLGLALMLGTATASAQPAGSATAELRNSGGQVAGSATFTQEAGGSRISVQVHNLPPGQHGIHLHAVGQCDPPDFTSAGGHFNPANRQHGLRNPQGPHAGDLPNLTIGPDGSGTLQTTNALVSLGSGANSLFDADGSALVIHADVDDEVTDPTGNSGGRIACGVITRAAIGPAPAQAPQWLPRTGGAAGGAMLSLPLASLGAAVLLLGVAARQRRG